MVMATKKGYDEITEQEKFLERKRNECKKYSVQELKDYFIRQYDSYNDIEVEQHLEECESCRLKALKVGNTEELIKRIEFLHLN